MVTSQGYQLADGTLERTGHETLSIYLVLRDELNHTREAFHALADTLSLDDWQQPSLNPAWTVGALTYHITVALQFLPEDAWMIRHAPWMPQPPEWLFHHFNEWYTRRGGRKYTPQTVTQAYDKAHRRVTELLKTIDPSEWQKSASYPGWDPLLDGTVTLEDLFHYPAKHFEYHAAEIRESLEPRG